jgi:hypothetical protein
MPANTIGESGVDVELGSMLPSSTVGVLRFIPLCTSYRTVSDSDLQFYGSAMR